MKNIKKRLIVSGALLATMAPLLAPTPVEASSVGEHVFPTGAGYYPIDLSNDLPMVLKMLKSHPDFEYYRKNEFTQKDGNVYLYLQQYKDGMYYYSPAVRYLQKDSNKNGVRPDGSVDVVAREVLKRLQGTPFYPTLNVPEHLLINNAPRVRKNPLSGEARGHDPVHHDTRTKPAMAMAGLNIRGNLNFRSYTSYPALNKVWSPENMTKTSVGHPTRHQDTKYTRGSFDEWGEFRELGYHRNGQQAYNPFFPPDGMRPNGSDGFIDYPLLAFPWSQPQHRNKSRNVHSTSDELTYQWAMKKGMYGLDTKTAQFNKKTDWVAAKAAYTKKYEAMRVLYDRTSSVRESMKRHGYSNRNDAVQALTVKYGSLQSPPPGSGFSLSVNFARAISGGKWYFLQATIPNENDVSIKLQDAQVRTQRVYRDDKLLQTFTRSASGVTTSVPKIAPEVEPGQKLKVVTDVVLQDGFRTAYNGDLEFDSNYHSASTLARNGEGNLRVGGLGTNRFEHSFKVPKKEGKYELETFLDKEKYYNNWDMSADSNANWGKNTLNIVQDRGNFDARNVELIDKNNKVVTTPIPGQEYKMRYGFKYTSVNGLDARRSTNVRVDYTVGREMVGSPIHGYEESDTKRTKTLKIKPEHNRTYTFDSEYFVFETAQFDTTGTVRVSENRYNEDDTDNTHNNRWESAYDLGVSNVRVLPSDTVNTQPGTATALVQFDVEYDTPDGVNRIGQDVDFMVIVDGKAHEVTEHVRNGMNPNISVPVDVELDGKSNRTIEATVIANHTRDVYETDINTQKNNVGKDQAVVNNPTIKSFTDSNPVEKWNQHIHVNSWKGKDVGYKTFAGETRNFLKFLTADNPSVTTRALSENYQIESVWFRSRLTRTEEMGPKKDGWVDLLKEEGFIRAGYGYELEVDVSYETNAFDAGFAGATGTSGRWTRPLLTEPLLQDNVYIEMPDGQLRSARGDGGTQQSLRLKERTGDASNTSWTFEIDGGVSLGASTVGRFYIGDDVEDGRYSLNVFTPRMRGANGKMTSTSDVLEHLLYDSAPDLGINVIGSSVDDISDHINR